MAADWELAGRKKLSAFRQQTPLQQLIIVAEGEKPNPCYEVKISDKIIKTYPGQYELVWKQVRSACESDSPEPYTYRSQPIGYDITVKTVRVNHRDGYDDIVIE